MEKEADLNLGDERARVGSIDAVRAPLLDRTEFGRRGDACAKVKAVKHGGDGALGGLAHRGRVATEEVAQEERHEAEVVVLHPDDVARVDFLLDCLCKEEVRLAVREPVRVVERDLSRVVCRAGVGVRVASIKQPQRGGQKDGQWKRGQRMLLEKPL